MWKKILRDGGPMTTMKTFAPVIRKRDKISQQFTIDEFKRAAISLLQKNAPVQKNERKFIGGLRRLTIYAERV